MSWTVRLNCGKNIYLQEIYQYHVETGVLEGTPPLEEIVQIEEQIVGEAMRTAKRLLGTLGDPYLILMSSENRRVDIACLAKFDAHEPARNLSEDGSSLVFVWFQGDFALPIDPKIVERIREVDWNALASDWSS